MKKIKFILPALLCLSSLAACDKGEDITNDSVSISGEYSSVVESTLSQSDDSESSSEQVVADGDLYASPTGGALDALGTRESPYSVNYAMMNLKPGKKIILLEGTYRGNLINTSDLTELYPATCEEERKIMEPEKDASGNYVEVLFDFSSFPFNSSNRGITINTDYWTIRNFKVTGAGDNGVYIGGNHNVVENLEVYACKDSGIQLGRAASSLNSIAEWPSYNLIKNCTSHDNADPSGEDSDGFACKLTTGYGNVFQGCIAYNNIDDGWDLYTKGESGAIGPVTLIDCVAFNNGMTSYGVGTANSDGNGFKLGGETIAVSHVVKNCVAFNNMATGFTDNSNPGTIYFENCTSFNNGTRDDDGYNFATCRDRATSLNVYKNCLSYCYGDVVNPIDLSVRIANSMDDYKGTADHCAFYNGLSNLYIGDIQACDYGTDEGRGQPFLHESNPFVSIESPQPQTTSGVDSPVHNDVHNMLRNEDGSVNLGDFLKLNSSSSFYHMGENGTPLGASLHD